MLIGGTGTGKSHLTIAIARALIRNGSRGRLSNVVDLVNRLETEHRNGDFECPGVRPFVQVRPTSDVNLVSSRAPVVQSSAIS